MPDYKFSKDCSSADNVARKAVPMRICTSALYNSANRNNPYGGIPGDMEIVIDIPDEPDNRPHILELIKQTL